MTDQQASTSRDIKPRFGRLLFVCALSVVFCGVLVYLMGDIFSDCCDLSWLDRLTK
jgi:hypothetical protein